jgi:hypothetical protein
MGRCSTTWPASPADGVRRRARGVHPEGRDPGARSLRSRASSLLRLHGISPTRALATPFLVRRSEFRESSQRQSTRRARRNGRCTRLRLPWAARRLRRASGRARPGEERRCTACLGPCVEAAATRNAPLRMAAQTPAMVKASKLMVTPLHKIQRPLIQEISILSHADVVTSCCGQASVSFSTHTGACPSTGGPALRP